MPGGPLLTVAQLRDVIAALEALLPLVATDPDRLDLHQTLANLHRRLVTVTSRQLAATADVPDAWRAGDGRDVALLPSLRDAVVGQLRRLAPAAEATLAARARRLAAVLDEKYD